MARVRSMFYAPTVRRSAMHRGRRIWFEPSIRPGEADLHPLEEQMTFMDWLYRLCFLLAIVGLIALVVVLLGAAVSAIV